MLAQLIQNFVHFKGRNDRLDQYGGLDAALRNTDRVLRGDKHLIPEARLEMTLELGQIEVRPKPTNQQLFGVMEHVQRKIEQAARDTLTIHGHMLFIEMPAARTHDERRNFFVQVIRLAVLFERNRAANRIDQIDLPFDLIRPFWRICILKIGHVAIGTRVQSIDHHLAIGGPCDLNATALQRRWDRCDLPVTGPNRCGFSQKIQMLTGVKALSPLDPGREQFATSWFELPMEARH